MKRAAAFALACLLPSTTGCIAAVIPLAAGAALTNRQSDRADRVAGTAPQPALPPAAAAAAKSELAVVLTPLTALPPPAHAPGLDHVVPAFRDYAVSRPEPQAGTRESAILASASDLRVVRVPCISQERAVFIDLDPGRGTFDPLAPGAADPALAAALTALRERGVAIVWFSRLGANFTQSVRAALVEGGLDPAGKDEIALVADLAERKQSLRDAVARRVCPIAMLGDERADFDELYLYLKDPEAAAALDAMIGKGWFLASPFAPPTDQATASTP